MTIGILAVGPCAGLAVFRALAAIEKVATGSIGGYAAFAILDAAGRVHRAETQRGGSQTLFIDGETTGVMPPEEISTARFAAVMSSGPDRPAPLSQFVAAAENVGLVTGHRLPNAAGVSGVALNLQIIEGLREGLSVEQAVDQVMDANPHADAGVIAADYQGRVYARNTSRVRARPDLGQSRREDVRFGAVVEILHNAIFPTDSLAALATEIAMDTMVPRNHVSGKLLVSSGTPLMAGTSNRVLVDGEMRAMRLEVTDLTILTGKHNCAAIYLNAEIVKDGRIIGYTLVEPNAIVDEGKIVSLSGQDMCWVAYRAIQD
ncbi:MAG: hypothetical protein WBA42_15330 [Mesorhizobium sp.]